MATRIRGSLQSSDGSGRARSSLTVPIVSPPEVAPALRVGQPRQQDGRRGLPGANAVVAAAPNERRDACWLYGLTFLSAIGGLLFGYDTGVISGAMLLLVAEFGFTAHQQGLIVSVTLLGCIAAALCASCLTECLGRRPTILLGSVIFAVGAAVMATADGLHMLLVGRFIIGLAVGVASMAVPMYIAEAAPPSQRGTLVTLNNVFVTGGQFVACVVAALLSKVDYPHGWRYMLGGAAIPALVQLVGFLFLPESPRWLAKYRGKESARQVLRQLRGTHDVSVELASILASIDEDSHISSGGSLSCCAALRIRPVRRAMTLGCMLQLVQQLTGINTVMYYCGTIFVMAGFTDPTLAIWLTAGVSFIGWLFCCVGVLAVERLGRRKLTLSSLAVVVFALLALGGGFWYLDRSSAPVIDRGGSASANATGDGHHHPSHGHASLQGCAEHRSCLECVADSKCGVCYPRHVATAAHRSGSASAAGYCVLAGNASAHGPAAGAPLSLCRSLGAHHGQQDNSSSGGSFTWSDDSCPGSNTGGKIALGATALYLAGFQPGMGTMPWTVNSEIYPLHARSLGMSCATMTNWGANWLVSYSFLPLTQHVTAPVVFWIYAGIGAIGWLWFACWMPETKGLGLEEIEQLFTRHADKQAKQWARRDPSVLNVHKYVVVK
jgi:SP family myo-inositol transporter-like MFS transporter 13